MGHKSISFLTLIALFLGPLHGALESHTYCSVHGEMVHDSHHHAYEDTNTRDLHVKSADDSEHEHCNWKASYSEHEDIKADFGFALLQLNEKVVCSHHYLSDKSSLYLEYPKNSPPLLS